MDDSPLTGAQRAFLRGLGQRLSPGLTIGREGVSEAVKRELEKLLHAHELVKIRFLGADRDERSHLCAAIASSVKAECVGAVGHTALFFRANAAEVDRRVTFPD